MTSSLVLEQVEVSEHRKASADPDGIGELIRRLAGCTAAVRLAETGRRPASEQARQQPATTVAQAALRQVERLGRRHGRVAATVEYF
jgi:hypothetical protein